MIKIISGEFSKNLCLCLSEKCFLNILVKRNPAKREKGQTGYLEAGQECCGLEDQPSKDFSKVRTNHLISADGESIEVIDMFDGNEVGNDEASVDEKSS